ncbi:MAG: hypothetical protein GY861_00115 [bacterium]|nr:hypothetical protein [bacterium]
MTPKITPCKRIKRFEKYNCAGKLRVQVNEEGGEITEVICMPKKGGCKYNLQLIGRLISGMLECNIDIHYITSILEANDPCPAVVMRMKREDLPQEDCGIGGCSKIILNAITEKLNEISK